VRRETFWIDDVEPRKGVRYVDKDLIVEFWGPIKGVYSPYATSYSVEIMADGFKYSILATKFGRGYRVDIRVQFNFQGITVMTDIEGKRTQHTFIYRRKKGDITLPVFATVLPNSKIIIR